MLTWITKARRRFVTQPPTGQGAPDWDALHREADKAYPGLVQTLLDAFAQMGQMLTREMVLARVQMGSVSGMEDTLRAGWADLSPALQTQVQEQLGALLVASARVSVPVLEGLIGELTEGQVLVTFGRINEAALTYIDQHAARLVVEVGDETVAAIRGMLERGFRDGRRPDQIADDVRAMVGLTSRQVEAVERFREGLEAQGYSPGRIADLARKKLEEARTYRAQNIMRTETIDAATEGQAQLWRQAEERGWMPTDMKRHWITAKDERLCVRCAPIPSMNPNGVGLHEPFRTPSGPVMQPTQHPSCRCTVSLRRARTERV